MKRIVLLMLVAACGMLSAQVPTNNLVGYYPFTGNANDLSGNSLNGTVNGATLTTDRFGNSGSAYQFNGTSNYISLPAGSYTTLNVYSYSFWIKWSGTQAGMPICFGESSVGYCQGVTVQNTGTVFAGSYNQGSSPLQSYITSQPITANQWVHVVVTRDLSNINLYINGTPVNTISAMSTNGQNASYGSSAPIRAYIGARTLNSTYFSGSIDDVRIYSSVMTQTAVTALYTESCFSVNPATSYTTCTGGAVTLTASPTPSSTISWYSSSTSTNAIATGTAYTTPPFSVATNSVFYVASNNCTAYARTAVNISAYQTPTVSLQGGAICQGQSFVLSPSGASGYTYLNGGPLVSPANTSTYAVTGISSQGCAASNTAINTVTVNITPTITVASGFICSGKSYTLSPSGASSYTYSSGSAIVSPTSNTSYTVTGTSGNGCYGSAVANVAVMANPTLAISGASNVCLGNSATLTATGADFYNWSTSSSSSVIVVTPGSTTTYSLTGASIFGCFSSKTFVVNVRPYPVVSVQSGSVCSGKNFNLSPSGAATYFYSTGSSSIVSPNVTTSYSVSGVSSFGCASSNTAVATVTVIPSPTLAVTSGTICAGQSFTLNPTGALSYTFAGGSAVVSPGSTSNYLITGINSAGCTGTVLANVLVRPLPNVVISGSTAICAGLTRSFTASGAATYTWNTGATTNVIAVSPSVTTSYTVTGESAFGCVKTATRQLTVHALPVIGVNSGTTCPGRAFTLTPSGAVSYTYTGGSAVVSPTVTTSYSVTGSSGQGCISQAPAVATVSVVPGLTVTVNSGAICIGNSFTMVPSGGISYTYSGGSAVVSPAGSTNYTVTGANNLGCTAKAVAAVTVNPLPVISISSQSTCIGSAAGFTVSGASSYLWSTGATTSVLAVTPAVNTQYTVTATSAQGCVKQFTALAVVAPLPTVSLASGTVCQGESFTLTPSGAASYTFSSGSAIVNPNVTTSYSVTGTSAQGCVSGNTAVNTVTVIAAPVLSVNSGSTCPGSAFVIVPTGATSYSYSTGSATIYPFSPTTFSVFGISSAGCQALIPATGTVSIGTLPALSVNGPTAVCLGSAISWTPSGASTYTLSGNIPGPVFTFTPSSSGTYTLYGTGANGCTGTAAVPLTVNQLPTLSVNSGSICPGESFLISPSGASSYSVTGGTYTVTPTVTSSYTITGTSADGCDALQPVISTVHLYPAMSVTIFGPSMVCSGQQATLSTSGAGSYTWSTSSNAPQIVIAPTIAGVYSVAATSTLGGCTGSANYSVGVYANPTINVASGAICTGYAYTLTPTGASGYTFMPSGPVVTPASTTSYTIIGIDGNGCESSAVATVSVVNALSVTVSGNSAICSGGSATLTANGASSYNWSNSQQGNVIVVSPASNTSYTVEGASGSCSATAVVEVTVLPLPVVSVNNGTICAGQSFTISPSGALNYIYSTQLSVITPAASMNYTVFGADSAGCVSQPAIGHVLVNPLPVITATSSSAIICEGDQVTLSATGGLSYQWSTGGTGASTSVLLNASASITVTGTDANGCSSEATVTVQVTNCTGIAESHKTGAIDLLPNPNAGDFMVNNPGAEVVMTVTDLKGAVVYVKTLAAGSVTRCTPEALARGLYICRYTRAGVNIGQHKLVIAE